MTDQEDDSSISRCQASYWEGEATESKVNKPFKPGSKKSGGSWWMVGRLVHDGHTFQTITS